MSEWQGFAPCARNELKLVITLCMQLFIHTVLCAELSLASLITLANSIGP